MAGDIFEAGCARISREKSAEVEAQKTRGQKARGQGRKQRRVCGREMSLWLNSVAHLRVDML